jgi:hypothetical protein
MDNYTSVAALNFALPKVHPEHDTLRCCSFAFHILHTAKHDGWLDGEFWSGYRAFNPGHKRPTTVGDLIAIRIIGEQHDFTWFEIVTAGYRPVRTTFLQKRAELSRAA